MKYLFLFLLIFFLLTACVKYNTADGASAYRILDKQHRDTIYVLVYGQTNINGFNDGLYDTCKSDSVQAWNGEKWIPMKRTKK